MIYMQSTMTMSMSLNMSISMGMGLSMCGATWVCVNAWVCECVCVCLWAPWQAPQTKGQQSTQFRTTRYSHSNKFSKFSNNSEHTHALNKHTHTHTYTICKVKSLVYWLCRSRCWHTVVQPLNHFWKFFLSSNGFN